MTTAGGAHEHDESGGPAVDLETEPLTDLDAARDEWRALAELSGNLFATWEWMSVWWRHFGRDRPRLLVACRDRSGRLVAILPLYLARSLPLRVVRFLGHGPGDHLGPICAPEHRPAAVRALHRVLAERPWRWQAMLAERLPSEEGWAPLVGGREINHEKSPVLSTEGRSWDEFLASQSRNFRSQVGRLERKLTREHGLRYRLADDPDHLEEDLDTLFRLHEARWGHAEEGGLHGARQPFHREFAALALERGWLRLSFLEAGGQPVAVRYGFRFGGDHWAYQAGRDPSWDNERVGFVLLCHSIREAFHDGMTEYRLLRGGEEYKDRFSTSDGGLDTLLLTRGAAGLAARGAIAGASGLPDGARQRLKKLAG